MEAMIETTPANPPIEDAAEVLPDEELIFVLGRALHQAGLPLIGSSRRWRGWADRLGLTVHSFCLPTGLLLCSERVRHSATVLIRLSPKPTDLERLRRLDDRGRGFGPRAALAP